LAPPSHRGAPHSLPTRRSSDLESWQDRDDETVGECAQHRATASARGVAVDTCCTTGKEVRNQAWQNQRDAEHWVKPYCENRQANEPTNEGENKADENSVLCIRKHDWGIERWNRTWYNLRRNALEGWDELTQNGADTKKNHSYRDTELQALGNRLHDEVTHICGAAFKS